MRAAITFLAAMCITLMPLRGIAQDADYQTGKIIDVEKLPAAASPSAGSDAPAATEVDIFNLKIQIGGTIYTCHAKTPGGSDLDWTRGKEVQAKVNGKVMYIKRTNGKVTKLGVVATKKSD